MGRMFEHFLNKIKNKKIIIPIVSVAVAAVVVTSVCLVLSRKSPREFYLDAEGKNFKKYSLQIKNIMKDFYAEQEPYMNSRHKKRSEITVQINSKSDSPFGIEGAQGIFDIVNRCKIIIDTKADPIQKKNYSGVSLLFESAPLIDAAAFKKEGQIGFSVPVLFPDRYFVLSPEKVDEVYERFNVPIRPKRLVNKTEIANTITYSDDKLDGIVEEYGKLISGFIKENHVKYGDKVEVKVGDEIKMGREVVVSLGSEETGVLAKELFNKAGSDDILLSLTYGNIADVMNLVDETGFFQLLDVLESSGYLQLHDYLKTFLNSLNIKKDTEGFKTALRSLGDRLSYPEGLNMTLIIDKSGNILERKVDIAFKKADEASAYTLNIHTGTNDFKNINFNNLFGNITITRPGSDGEKLQDVFSFNSHTSELQKARGEKGKREIAYEKKTGDRSEYFVSVALDIDKSTDETTLKRNSTIKYDIKFREKETDQTDTISGEINTVKWENQKRKTRNSNSEIVMNFDISSFELKDTNIKFNLTNEDRFEIEEFALPQISSENSIDLGNISDEDMVKLENELFASAGKFYLANKSVIDAVMK